MAAPGHYPLQSQASAPASYQSLQSGQQPPPPIHPTMSQAPMMSPTKEVNAITVCRLGQDCVHDIVQKAQDVFKVLAKGIQLPNGLNATPQLFQERRLHLEEQLKLMLVLFRKLRAISDKVDESSTQIEEPLEELIPYVGSQIENEATNSEVYRVVVDEHREVVEQVRLKNQELKDIIDQIRTIIWEINTMITMRKT
ncbi:mediator of RNA polymerase II transcription subunit 30-like isoform X2 [Gigantopelta aegis]|uniref:mediator of RNA polymerase II transcription subunit 30-like isoform X2 n=1 Tax=Gigantopelta aegis TaxID=1735272 RepID=UPI001B88C4F6|nr:mediator of RNA polymerase II transcription subunit 30-like isoform X2 [Gigantopelta aegis]